MRVAIVSSAGKCGIAEHSTLLMQHVRAADPDITFSGNPEWLDPDAFDGRRVPVDAFDLVHLNYHRGLHSRWTPEKVQRNIPHPVVITFHDTYEIQPDRLPWDLLDCSNVQAMIVHEHCDLCPTYLRFDGVLITKEDLSKRHKVRFWRQACPSPTGRGWGASIVLPGWEERAWRPTLGTLGFDFPWKNYDMLAEVTGELGWRLRIVGEVSVERRVVLLEKNPRTHFDGFLSTAGSVSALSACDATAFLYTCANSGTSGAIRVGITAARPLLAAKGCRQFRDLEDSEALGFKTPPIQFREPSHGSIADWLNGYSRSMISTVAGYDATLVALAHRESWARQGAQYAALYQEILCG